MASAHSPFTEPAALAAPALLPLAASPLTAIAAGPTTPAATQTTDITKPPTLLSITEVAAYFGRSVGTVRRWTRRGEFQAVRIGRVLFYRAEDI